MAIFYQPPANINDFSRRPALAGQLGQNWHDYIQGAIARRNAHLFYDAARDPAAGTPATRAPVVWSGFPRSLWQWFSGDTDSAGAKRAFAAADTLAPEQAVFKSSNRARVDLFARQQDEYCEWFAHRKAGGITRITFTCEGPEYFEIMAATDISLVGDLYRENVDPAVKDSDLVWAQDMVDENGDVVFPKGSYNKLNDWNTRAGAMHLTHGANTLGAEINLAADATVIYPVSATPANTFPLRLICCSGFGGVNRSSDPTIGAGVNGLARSGFALALANPVGLYITEIAIDGLRSPTGAMIGPPALHLKRASADGTLILRAELAPPPGAGYTLDQCTFEGRPVTGGGEIARRVTVGLFGLAKRVPGRVAQNLGCRNKCCQHPSGVAFSALVEPGTDCGGLPASFWNGMAPVEPGMHLAGIEAPALSAAAVKSKKAAGRGFWSP